MHGLKAVELLSQGKVIQKGERVYILCDNVVKMYKLEASGHIDYSKCVTNVVIPINNLGYKLYEEPKPLTGWERSETYWTLNGEHEVQDEGTPLDDTRYKYANYFSTEEKRNKINDMGAIQRIVQRYADMNNSEEIDWNNPSQDKWGISYNHEDSLFCFFRYSTLHHFGQVYFTSEELASQAVEELNNEIRTYFGRLSKCQKN